jgi:hypothetical protein
MMVRWLEAGLQATQTWQDTASVLLFLALFALVILSGMALVAIAALAVAGLIMLLVAVGALATSTVVGWRTRSVSTGFKLRVIQLSSAGGGLAGAAGGTVLGWLVREGTQTHVNLGFAGAAGGIAGLLAGFFAALAFNWLWYRALNWLLRRFGRKHTLDSSSYDDPDLAPDRKPRHRDL